MMPGADDRRDRRARLLDVVERGERDLRELRLRQQLDRDFGDHREQALAAGDERERGRSPALSSASPPNSTTSPLMSTPRTRRTLCTVRPYLRQCTPPAFSATLPPIVHAICDDGSGA